MQIVKYEANKNILTVGFKEDGFVVYTQIHNDLNKTKQELLQKAYTQCKNSIVYERTLNEHSFTTDKIGETFIPEVSKLKSIELIIPNKYIQFEENQESISVNLESVAKDQYGDVINEDIVFSTSYGSITDNVLVLPKVCEVIVVEVSATSKDVMDKKLIELLPYKEPEITEKEMINQLKDLWNITNANQVSRVDEIESLVQSNIPEFDTVFKINNTMASSIISQGTRTTQLETLVVNNISEQIEDKILKGEL